MKKINTYQDLLQLSVNELDNIDIDIYDDQQFSRLIQMESNLLDFLEKNNIIINDKNISINDYLNEKNILFDKQNYILNQQNESKKLIQIKRISSNEIFIEMNI